MRTLLVVLTCLVAFGGFLGRTDLTDPDEARHAEIAREMLASHSWLTPQLQSEPYYDKPAPYYWILAASMATFGTNARAARLPSALAALWTLAAVAAFARRAYGARASRYAVMGLTTTLFFVAIGRYVLVDMLLTALLTSAFAWLGLWLLDPPHARRNPWPFYAAIGLATLAKGPVAIAIAALACASVAWRLPRGDLRELALPRGLAIIAGVAAPFYVAAWLRDPAYVETFLWHHNVERFATQVRLHNDEPWFYYLIALPLALLPWTPVVLAAVATRLRERARTSADHLCLAWAGATVLLFATARTRLITYMLPAFPPLACLAASYAVSLTRRDEAPRLLRMYVVAWIGILLIVGCGYSVALGWSYPSVRHVAYPSLVLMLPVALALAYAWNAATSGVLLAQAIASLAVVAWLYGPGADVRNALASMRNAATIVAGELPSDAQVYAYRCPGNALAFYSARRVTNLYDEAAVHAALDDNRPVALLTKPRLLSSLGLDPPQTGESIRWHADDHGPLPVYRVLVLNRAAAASREARRPLEPR